MSKNANRLSLFGNKVARQAALRERSIRNGPGNIWFGLSTSGLVGWTIAAPAVLGALIGLWLDKHHPSAHSWTLALLAAGLVFGCWNAWNWVEKQGATIASDVEHDDV